MATLFTQPDPQEEIKRALELLKNANIFAFWVRETQQGNDLESMQWYDRLDLLEEYLELQSIQVRVEGEISHLHVATTTSQEWISDQDYSWIYNFVALGWLPNRLNQ